MTQSARDEAGHDADVKLVLSSAPDKNDVILMSFAPGARAIAAKRSPLTSTVALKTPIVISYTSKDDYRSLNKLMKNSDFRLVYRPIGKIHQFLPRFKDTPTYKGCIYGIKCHDCNQLYVGETMKDAGERILQHKSAVARGDTKASALAHHWIKEGHGNLGFSDYTIIETESDLPVRKVTEAYYIRKLNATLNRQEERGRFEPDWFLLDSWPKEMK